MASLTHNWVFDPDEEMWVCGNCDTYRGSRASMQQCSAFLETQKQAHAAGRAHAPSCPDCQPAEL